MKNILAFLKRKPSYVIDKKDIKRHARLMFNLINKFYSDVKKITFWQKNQDVYKLIIKDIEDNVGFGPNSKYNNEFLNNENFKMLTIYHLGISQILKRNLFYGEYGFYKQMIEHILDHNKHDFESYDSKVLNMFGVNPTTLPLKYIQKISLIDEWAKAMNIIFKKIKKLNSYDTYNSYTTYYNYVNDEIVKLTQELHGNGFYNTHDIERFTVLAISFLCNMPTMDSLYKKPIEDSDSTTLPTHVMKTIQKKIFESIGKGVGDEFTENDNEP